MVSLSSRIVCRTRASGGEKSGQVSVKVSGGELGLSTEMFTYQVCLCPSITCGRVSVFSLLTSFVNDVIHV